jgi:hypothetical protein
LDVTVFETRLANVNLIIDLADPPKPYDVKSYGTDTSGRPIYLNARMALGLAVGLHDWPSVSDLWLTQGAYMSRVPGGGADGSAGYHDEGGPVDFRDRDFTAGQITRLVAKLREVGWAAWRRDVTHGGFEDPHVHAALMGDRDAAYGIRDQFTQYANGQNGLADRGPDYEDRPVPIVLDFDYYATIRRLRRTTPDEEEDVTPEELLKTKINKDGETVGDALRASLRSEDDIARIRKSVNTQLAALRQKIREMPPAATKADVEAAIDEGFSDITATIELVPGDGA